MRVLVFGDSVAQGMWDGAGGWVQRVRTYYDRQHVQTWGDEPEIINVSVSGDRVNDLLLRMNQEVEARKWFKEPFGLVIAVGINDAALEHGKPVSDIKHFYKQLAELYKQAAKLSQHVLIVGLTTVDESTDVASDPAYAYTNQRITEYNTAIREVAEDCKLLYAPLDEKTTEPHLLSDGLHPNDMGHARIAETLLPLFDQLFS